MASFFRTNTGMRFFALPTTQADNVNASRKGIVDLGIVSPPMWPGFHADQVRARGKRPSVRLELGEIRAILAARKEHSPMPRSPIRIRRDGLVRG